MNTSPTQKADTAQVRRVKQKENPNKKKEGDSGKEHPCLLVLRPNAHTQRWRQVLDAPFPASLAALTRYTTPTVLAFANTSVFNHPMSHVSNTLDKPTTNWALSSSSHLPCDCASFTRSYLNNDSLVCHTPLTDSQSRTHGPSCFNFQLSTCVPSEREWNKCIECELVIVAWVVSLFFSKEILCELRMTCPLPASGWAWDRGWFNGRHSWSLDDRALRQRNNFDTRLPFLHSSPTTCKEWTANTRASPTH